MKLFLPPSLNKYIRYHIICAYEISDEQASWNHIKKIQLKHKVVPHVSRENQEMVLIQIGHDQCHQSEISDSMPMMVHVAYQRLVEQ